MHGKSAPDRQQTSWTYNLVSATLAFFLWGSWAWYINSRSETIGRASPVVSGLTQGVGSFCITLMMVKSVTWLYSRLPNNMFRLLLPAIITASITGVCLFTIHTLIGTSNVVGTVVPALTVALFFTLFTTFRIRTADC